MSADMADTVELGRVRMPSRHAASPGVAGGGFWRGLAGALAMGLLLLALVLAGAEAVAADLGVEGPGLGAVAGHAGAALLAFVAAQIADRSVRMVTALAVAAAVVITAGVLWVFWLA